MDQYKSGTADYLQVITAQAASLQAHKAALDLLGLRMTTDVLLIEGWAAVGRV
jgi:outer membrane protein TolC